MAKNDSLASLLKPAVGSGFGVPSSYEDFTGVSLGGEDDSLDALMSLFQGQKEKRQSDHGRKTSGEGGGHQDAIHGISRQPLKNVIIPKPNSPKGRKLLETYKGVTLQPNALLSLIAADRATKGNLFGMGAIGSYRSMAEQRRVYAQKPGLAAPPGQSYHQKGLAIDAGDLSKQVQKYLLHHGWNQFSRSTEPWHYSYNWTG